MTGLLFSQRYFRALSQNRLQVDVPEPVRSKVWSWLRANNPSLGIQRDPNDRWISNSSVLEETEIELQVEHGWEGLPDVPLSARDDYHGSLRHLFLYGKAPYVFDVIELAYRMMDAGTRETLRQRVNQTFELHDCPWKVSEGEFFKLDSDFVGARLASAAHESLAANRFAGACDEYARPGSISGPAT